MIAASAIALRDLGSTETHPRRFDPPQCESESGPFKSSSSAVPRWLYIIPWSHQGIPFLQNIISLLIYTHRPTDHSFIIQWQIKVTMSRSYQAGRPEPTVGPAPSGAISTRLLRWQYWMQAAARAITCRHSARHWIHRSGRLSPLGWIFPSGRCAPACNATAN